MTRQIFSIQFTPAIKDLAEAETIFSRLRRGSFYPDAGFFNGSILFISDSIAGSAIKGALDQYFGHRKPSVLALVDDAAAHWGLPQDLLNRLWPAPRQVAVVSRDSQDPLSKMEGMDDILDQFRTVSGAIVANRFLNSHLVTKITEGFLNFLLVGPKGVGKTTLANAFATSLRDQGVIDADAAIHFTAASALVGKHVGESENNLRAKMHEAKGGVLILDELDALLDVYSYGASLLNTLNTDMGNSKNNPIIIATCYGSRYDQLMSANEGLAGRFANTLHLQPYTNAVLIEIFKGKVHGTGLVAESQRVFGDLGRLIERVRKAKKDTFANAREIDNIFDAVLAQKNRRQKNHLERIMASVKDGGKLTETEKKYLRQIKHEDIPDFDGGLRAYVPKQPERTADMSARVVTTQMDGNVLRLPPR